MVRAGRPPRPAVRACPVHGWTSGVGACQGSGDCWIGGRMREREDIVHCSSEPASADRAVVSFSFSFFYYYFRLALVPCRESVRQGWHAGAVAVPVTRYIASAPPP